MVPSWACARKGNIMTKQPIISSSRKGRHLTIEDRSKIEYGLNRGHSIRSIAKELGKAPSSVKREIERNSVLLNCTDNDCAKLHSCKLRRICGSEDCPVPCSKKCRASCYMQCKDYIKRKCEKLEASPHVCNACKRLHAKAGRCYLDKKLYSATEAHERYRETLVERRSGFDLTLEEFLDIDDVVSPCIRKGQSPYHIIQNNNLSISLSTLYRLIDNGELEAGNLDLKQKVRRKPRKTARHDSDRAKKLKEAKQGHLYSDFLKYMDAHDTFHVEMDCVLGKRNESPALLTLHYPGLQMQLAFYLEVHNSKCVVAAIDDIEELLGYELFRTTFPVILTDNGQEFTNIKGIERSILYPGKKRTRLFFCEPNRSDEKGSCENNHRLIREVMPKSVSLKKYSQADVTLMMNHINSYSRQKSFGKCAYDLAMEVFPEEYFDLLGLYKIPANEVCLKPELLK